MKCFKCFDVHFTGLTTSFPHAYYTDVMRSNDELEEYSYGYDHDAQWYVDSGATNHITNYLDNLHVSSPYLGQEHVAVGNGNQLNIESVGKTSIPTSSQSLLLNNILYVPQITRHLVSVSQFTKDNNVLVEFHQNVCFVKDKQTQMLLMKGALVKGLYKLDLSSLKMQQKGQSVYLVQQQPRSQHSPVNESSPSKSPTALSICQVPSIVTSFVNTIVSSSGCKSSAKLLPNKYTYSATLVSDINV